MKLTVIGYDREEYAFLKQVEFGTVQECVLHFAGEGCTLEYVFKGHPENVIDESNIVDFDDILDSVEIEIDEDYRDPFEDDWLTHEIVYASPLAKLYSPAYTHAGQGLIEPTKTTGWEYFHKNGASKQVAWELAAEERKRAIERIKEVLENGTEYYYVQCEYRTYEDSVGGVDGEDYARGACARECALNVAHQMERDGWIVKGMPDTKAEYRENRRESLRWNLTRQNVG